jgi:DNA polymerase III subunit gamma/tau
MSDHNQWSVKYRPQTIDEFVGQPAAIAFIKGLDKSKKIPGCIGFFGPSGCGKTTLARLVAALFSGGSSDPRKNPDIADIPPAERSVADVRELIEKSKFSPRGGKRRCIIVNEAHVYTADAAKALLAAIEEPPPKTTWMLCTDQPERLPRQMANRMIPITLGLVSDAAMTDLLRWVLQCEKRDLGKAQDAIIKRIVDASYGVPRQSVQLLDMVNTAMLGGGKPSEAIDMAIRNSSVTESFDAAIKFIQAMLRDDSRGAVQALNESGNCEGMLHLMIRMLNGLAYSANGGRPKDGLGWAVVKNIERQKDVNKVLQLQAKMCLATDVLMRSNYQVPAESLLLAMVKK